ncbi:MAG: divalent-cation tolerance protein CutA [Mariprofundaceae bacterium]|nr:divalent-cation tolerance protein CutA [Mariprofundaceae bacterium]
MILTSVDDASMAKTLARQLVEGGFAACVQISAPGTSIYRWQGEVQETAEYFLSIKTNPSRCNEIKHWLERHHPYDTPEIIMLEGRAAETYATWVDEATSHTSNRPSKFTSSSTSNNTADPDSEAKHV